MNAYEGGGTNPYDLDMLQFATRFAVGFHGHTVHIERYSNHGRLLPDGQWMVVRHLFPIGSDVTNPLYLKGSAWLYKYGDSWDSWREAVNHLMTYAAGPGTNGWVQIREDPHAPYLPAAEAS